MILLMSDRDGNIDPRRGFMAAKPTKEDNK
jgi:hypothetical protein